MKRKDFIQKISFLGVGLSLAPWKLISASPAAQRFALPKPTIHIPHGNFAAAELEKLILPEFGLECSAQQFMRNGIVPSDDDLKVFSFQRRKEWVNIGVTRDGKTFSEGNITGLELDIDSFDDECFTVRMS